MRAKSRRRNHSIGTKWLRPRGIFPVSVTAERDESKVEKAVSEIQGMNSQQTCKLGMLIDNMGAKNGLLAGDNQGKMIYEDNAPIFKNKELQLNIFFINRKGGKGVIRVKCFRHKKTSYGMSVYGDNRGAYRNNRCYRYGNSSLFKKLVSGGCCESDPPIRVGNSFRSCTFVFRVPEG